MRSVTHSLTLHRDTRTYNQRESRRLGTLQSGVKRAKQGPWAAFAHRRALELGSGTEPVMSEHLISVEESRWLRLVG